MSWLVLTSILALAAAASDGDRLTHLLGNDPYYPSRAFPRLTTPQWVGEPGVEAVVVLSIDDMRDPGRYEAYLRPILERLAAIDGRAPVSVMTNSVDPADPRLAGWLAEGLSLETHTIEHPCPLLHGGDLGAARSTYERCVDLLSRVPGSRPVAYRMPCCDSMNSVSPRFFSEIFARTTGEGRFLTIDSSVFQLFTAGDPQNPRELVLDGRGRERFRPYLPADRSFVNTIEDYPYPYVIGGLCWELPCVVPSDWEGQHLRGPNQPQTVEDLKAALDLTVHKQGVFTLVFHPHGWIQNTQVVELIEHTVARHGDAVRFLTFREVQERLDRNLLAGHPLRRPSDGGDGGVRVLDLDGDGFQDVVVGGEGARLTRLWSPQQRAWAESSFPCAITARDESGRARDEGLRFGVGPGGAAFALRRDGGDARAWRWEGSAWVEAPELLEGLTVGEEPLATVADGRDRGVRLRDLDGDGASELLVANPDQRAAYRWSREARAWRRLPFALPEPTLIADDRGRDRGLRFADLDRDGAADLLYSNERVYSVHLFRSMEEGWTAGGAVKRGDDAQGVPPIVRADGEAGAWIHSGHLWVQNEDTAHLPAHVDRRSFGQLLEEVEPFPRAPQASRRCLQPAPGLRAELVAAEPLVADPIAIAWGGQGELYVVEMGDYPLGDPERPAGGGRVRRLVDDDGDGRYDRSTVFLDGLAFPTGVAPWRDGVLVTCAPEILFAVDEDGDGRADRREVLYSGFVEGNQQHRVNGLRWGLDNYWHGANGDSGGRVRSHATGALVDIRGRDFRLRPESGALEPEAGMTQFGKGRDDWGEWFGGNNSNPFWHFPLADRYVRRNPHVAPPPSHVDVSVAPGAALVFPVAPVFERFNDPGAARRFTSACSPIVYRDELLGPDLAGNLVVCEPVHNLVHREVMESAGTTFTSRRAAGEERGELLVSSDPWFRPVMVRTGPDGALWVVDMYRAVIEHPEWIPDDWEARLDLRQGHELGRIYRIVREDAPPRPIPSLASLDGAGLVAALESPNGWVRDHAQRILVERADAGALAGLERLAAEGRRATARLHALCALEGLGALRLEVLRPRLADAHPGVRRNALRLFEPFLRSRPESVADLLPLVHDGDARVRLQLACSLGESGDPRAAGALAALGASDADPYLIAAVLSSVGEDNLARVVEGVLGSPAGLRQPALGEALVRLAVAFDEPRAQVTVLEVLLGSELGLPQRLELLGELLDGLDTKGESWGAYVTRVLGPAQAPRIDSLARPTAALLADLEADERTRALALGFLSRTGAGVEVDTLADLLGPECPPTLQRAALDLLGGSDDPRAPLALLAGWRGYGPELRPRVISALLGRRVWAGAVLGAIADGGLPPRELDAASRQQLAHHVDADVRERARSLLGSALGAEREGVVLRYGAELAALNGDLLRGREVFRRTCVNCHRLAALGQAFGPDLRTTDRSTDALLAAILDPDRVVEARFQGYVALTTDGRIFEGVLSDETATSVTLLDVRGEEVVLLRSELEVLRSSGRSPMPAGLEVDIPPAEMADLLAFLRSEGIRRREFPGNEPRVLAPDADDGTLALSAATCEIFGPNLIFEGGYGNLGYWSSTDDLAVWTVVLSAPATFEVEIDYACPESKTGNALELRCDGESITWRVERTGSWDEYRRIRVGRLALPSGHSLVTARSSGGLEGYLIDLRTVRLTPVR